MIKETKEHCVGKKSRAKSFFSIKTQFGNLGDALINRELVSLAAMYGDVCVDLSRCPSSFVKTLEIDSGRRIKGGFGRLFVMMLLSTMLGYRCFYFLSPGGYLGELKIREMPSRVLNTLVLVLLRIFGVRICLVGVSYEHLGPRFLIFQRFRSLLFYRHFVRDGFSLCYAQDHGFKVHGIMPDLAFNLFQEKTKEATPVEIPKRVAFSFRARQYPSQWEDVRDTLMVLAEVLPSTTEYIFVVQVEHDRENMERLKSALEEHIGRPTSMAVVFQSINDCLKIYASCDLVVANRLHALLMGASQNGRMIAVIGEDKNRKIEGVLEALNMKWASIQAGKLNHEEMKAVIQRAMQSRIYGGLQRKELHSTMFSLLQSD